MLWVIMPYPDVRPPEILPAGRCPFGLRGITRGPLIRPPSPVARELAQAVGQHRDRMWPEVARATPELRRTGSLMGAGLDRARQRRRRGGALVGQSRQGRDRRL